MTLADSVHAFLRLMARAHTLGNVTRACEEAGISRTLAPALHGLWGAGVS